ncbi:MAG: lipid II flippase MurJ [Pseudomonadota bacterium]
MLLKAGILSLALLVTSRVLGLARESAQAAAFGSSGMGDLAVLMLTLPDLVAGLFASGALAYVLLPYWARQAERYHPASQRKVAGWLLAGGLLAGLALWLAHEHVVALLASGLPAELYPVAHNAVAFSAASVPMALLAALWGTRLQHERDFAGMYGASVVVNLVLVATLVSLVYGVAADIPVRYLGVALLASMLARLAWLGWRQRPKEQVPVDCAGLQEPMPGAAIWIWAALSAGVPLAVPLVARSIASTGGEGNLASFNYAWKLVELPLVFAIQLVTTLAFPEMARAFAQKEDVGPAVRRTFMLVWALACACAAGLLVGARPLAQLLFGWGRMTPDSVLRLADWAASGAWSLLPQALTAVSLTILAIRDRLRLAVLAYILALFALLLAGSWTAGDGTRLMLSLNLVFTGVAAASLLALGRGSSNWLPWRPMAVPGAAVVLLWGMHAGGVGVPASTGVLAGLAVAGATALAVLASAWLASGSIRRQLPR